MSKAMDAENIGRVTKKFTSKYLRCLLQWQYLQSFLFKHPKNYGAIALHG
jgi:hypothetical protein